MIKRVLNSPSLTTLINLSVKGSALLLINPFLFKFFTKEEVVIWYLVLSIISIQLIFDFGLLPNSTRILSRKLGELESNLTTPKAIENFKNQTYTIYLIFSFLVLVLTFLAAKVYLTHKINGYINIYLFYAILSLGCVGIFNNYFGTILQSLRKVEVLQRNLAISSLISIFLAFLSLFIFRDLGITLFCLFSNHIINFFLLPEHISFEDRFRKISFRAMSKKQDNELLDSSIRSGIGILCSLGFFHLINFYVADKFLASTAAQYMLFMQIIRAISSFSQAPFYAYIPDFNYLYGQKKNQALFLEINKKLNYSFLLFQFLVLIFSITLPFLFELIESEKSFEFNNLWKSLVIAFFLERISASFIQIITISKKIIWHWYNFFLAISMILVFYFLLNTREIISIPIAIGSVYAFLGIPLAIFILNKKMKFEYSNFLKMHLIAGIFLTSLLYASF